MANEPRRATQYFAAVGASMGGLCLGTVIGWSSPADKLIQNQLNVSENRTVWISSVMPLGAASAQIYMSITLDLFGRRLSMLLNSIPFILGWIILACAKSIPTYCFGRFVTGFFGGSFCVAAPTYIGEMADKTIRGTLGVFFQLLLVIGILLTFALGELKNLFALTIPLIGGPVAVFIIFVLLPESPVYLYKKGKVEDAKKSLQFFRGESYDISGEMKEMEQYTKTEDSFWAKFKTRACIKAFLMLVGMNVIQQLSGINAVMFFAHSIFVMVGAKISEGASAIIFAFVQVAFTCVSAYLIDRAGRKLLWVLSLSLMGVCLLFLGMFFRIKKSNKELSEKLAMLPLLLICLYIVGFSLATGPLPWVMLAEFLPNEVKRYVGTFAACLNWMLAFLVVQTFTKLVDALGADIVFWGFAIVCGAGLAFVILFLIETKNKTLEEIQTELGTPPT